MKNYERKELNLVLASGFKLYYNKCQLSFLTDDLMQFLDNNKYKISLDRSINSLFSQGIKYNNSLEGYHDSLQIIDDIINNKNDHNIKKEKIRRILNLYQGYKYILNEKEINKDNLKSLYDILSCDLLEKDDLNLMGKYYRTTPVYIYYSSDLTKKPDEGMPSKLVESSIDCLISFLNDVTFGSNEVETFIKSQIAHFYFVHIHPYYDINGRTARTLSMWYLMNNNANQFIIFNRGILLDKMRYYKIIRDVAKYANISYFLNYLLEIVKFELEKEIFINLIENKYNQKFTQQERQTIYNLISFKNSNNLLDFTTIYNRFNETKKPLEIYEQMILPLLNKNVLKIERDTKKQINKNFKNFIFNLKDEEEIHFTKKYK